jgi:hypothetical protein
MIDVGRSIAKPPKDLSVIVHNDEALSFVGICGWRYSRSIFAASVSSGRNNVGRPSA